MVIVQALAATLAVSGCVAAVVLLYGYGLEPAKTLIQWLAGGMERLGRWTVENPLRLILLVAAILGAGIAIGAWIAFFELAGRLLK